ncbi:hypothetical protein ACFX2I_031184 [Malus domestica]
MEEMRSGICLVLKEDQYLDSEVCLGVRGLGLCLGFTGKVLEIWCSAIDGVRVLALLGSLRVLVLIVLGFWLLMGDRWTTPFCI